MTSLVYAAGAAAEQWPPLLLRHCGSECPSPPPRRSPGHLFARSLLHFSGCRFETLRPPAGRHWNDVLCSPAPLHPRLPVQPLPLLILHTPVLPSSFVASVASRNSQFYVVGLLFFFLSP